MMKLPEGWTNFRIVETKEGCFTGQITREGEHPAWLEDDRMILVEYTRQYLEHHTGQKVHDYVS